MGKSSHLASCEHLERWCRRNREHGARLAERFQAKRLRHDWPALWHVARSLYRISEACSAKVWAAKRQLVPLGREWERILLDHRPAV